MRVYGKRVQGSLKQFDYTAVADRWTCLVDEGVVYFLNFTFSQRSTQQASKRNHSDDNTGQSQDFRACLCPKSKIIIV